VSALGIGIRVTNQAVMVMQPWTRLEGVLKNQNQPVAGVPMELGRQPAPLPALAARRLVSEILKITFQRDFTKTILGWSRSQRGLALNMAVVPIGTEFGLGSRLDR
jgi:hypothetical protein